MGRTNFNQKGLETVFNGLIDVGFLVLEETVKAKVNVARIPYVDLAGSNDQKVEAYHLWFS